MSSSSSSRVGFINNRLGPRDVPTVFAARGVVRATEVVVVVVADEDARATSRGRFFPSVVVGVFWRTNSVGIGRDDGRRVEEVALEFGEPIEDGLLDEGEAVRRVHVGLPQNEQLERERRVHDGTPRAVAAPEQVRRDDGHDHELDEGADEAHGQTHGAGRRPAEEERRVEEHADGDPREAGLSREAAKVEDVVVEPQAARLDGVRPSERVGRRERDPLVGAGAPRSDDLGAGLGVAPDEARPRRRFRRYSTDPVWRGARIAARRPAARRRRRRNTPAERGRHRGERRKGQPALGEGLGQHDDALLAPLDLLEDPTRCALCRRRIDHCLLLFVFVVRR
mmetsp:Transcript_15871/g.63983  ORF Transcript_15871/g.63983 Transcript_15871/m.63983 type:complete len:338 (+) Transcript_15871:1343-2356(+)